MIPLVLAMSFLSPATRCADLSGKYTGGGEDGPVYLSIAQTKCERVVMTWDVSNESTPGVPLRIVLDGRFHPTSDNPFGFPEMSASLNGPTLELLMRGQSPGDATNPYRLRFTLLADGDLCVTDDTGYPDPYRRYTRQYPGNPRAQQRADLRSGKACAVP